MIFKQKIAAGSVSEINQAGKHIKVINAQDELRMRVFNADGGLVLDSIVRSGFELTLKPFKYLTLESKIEQPFEIWCSFDALGYDAPSANANNLNSYKSKHYGGVDLIVPFEPNRLSIKVTSNEPWYYGGENVGKENGIFVEAGKVEEIHGAAAIYSFVDFEGEYKPSLSAVDYEQKNKMAAVVDAGGHGVFGLTGNNKLVKIMPDSMLEIELPDSVEYATDLVMSSDNKLGVIGLGSDYFYEYDLEYNTVKRYKIPNSNTLGDGYISRLNRVTHDGEKYVFIVNGKDPETGDGGTYSAIATLKNGVWFSFFKSLNTDNFLYRKIWALGVDKVVFEGSGLKMLDLSVAGDLEDSSLLVGLAGTLGGSKDYAQATETDKYFIFQGQGSSSKAVLVEKDSLKVVELGYCDCSAASGDLIVLFRGDELHITKDEGRTFEVIENVRPLDNKERAYSIFYNAKLFVISETFTGYYLTSKVRERVKQVFKVLKAFS